MAVDNDEGIAAIVVDGGDDHGVGIEYVVLLKGPEVMYVVRLDVEV